uniref:Uncharacterized protein n=1 Tax=Anguilla anguilla TaxID=7936 RepID=A0A0E9UXH3_ANGAN
MTQQLCAVTVCVVTQ